MLYYERTDVSEGADVSKLSASEELFIATIVIFQMKDLSFDGTTKSKAKNLPRNAGLVEKMDLCKKNNLLLSYKMISKNNYYEKSKAKLKEYAQNIYY